MQMIWNYMHNLYKYDKTLIMLHKAQLYVLITHIIQ